MAAAGEVAGGYSSSDLDFFRKSHLNISRLPSLSKADTNLESIKKPEKPIRRTAERSHNYWRIFQHISVENMLDDHHPKTRGVSRITTRRLQKTLYGDYPKDPEVPAVKPKTASTDFKLPSLDSKLGAKSVFWRWNSLSEDLRKGRIVNFHQVKFDPKSVPLAHGAVPASVWRWERASSKYNYRTSPRYHVQFLEDIHQTRKLGWKGKTKMIRSGKVRPLIGGEDEEEGEEEEEEESEEKQMEDAFEAALATNISGIDDNPLDPPAGAAADTAGGATTEDLLAGLGDDNFDDSKVEESLGLSANAAEDSKEDDKSSTEGAAAQQPAAADALDKGLTGIEEIPEPTDDA